MTRARNIKKVTIIHRIIAPYRVPFYQQLRDILATKGIDLSVIYGYPRQNETEPYSSLSFGIQVKTRYLIIGERFLVWLSAIKYACSSNLVIVQQSNTNLINYLLIIIRKLFGFKLAFWGHGINFQARNRKSVGERFKKYYSKHSDYWFAYTELSKDVISKAGFQSERITSVNNAVDTNEMRKVFEDISDDEINNLKNEYGIGKNDPIGIFCSRIYKDKRIDFLLNCLGKIKNRVDNFHFFVIGDGEEANKIKKYADSNGSWFHWVGTKYGREKIRIFKMAGFQLMPGLVGLHVVDSFVMHAPIITTNIKYHSPEIIYLKDGNNGIITDNDEEAYVAAVVKLIDNPSQNDKLKKGCAVSQELYTIENMVTRFSIGICNILGVQSN